jgi:hypothetical protein
MIRLLRVQVSEGYEVRSLPETLLYPFLDVFSLAHHRNFSNLSFLILKMEIKTKTSKKSSDYEIKSEL